MDEKEARLILKLLERLQNPKQVLDAVDEAVDTIQRLKSYDRWHTERWNALQKWQASIPDPFRQEFCEIFANGYSTTWKKRYASEQVLLDRIERAANVLRIFERDPGAYARDILLGLVDGQPSNSREVSHEQEEPGDQPPEQTHQDDQRKEMYTGSNTD